jgi:hypothetical protein
MRELPEGPGDKHRPARQTLHHGIVDEKLVALAKTV